jgi:hypothetical protein
MLEVCTKFANDHDVKFNPSKNNLLVYGGFDCVPFVNFMCGTIDVVKEALNLGMISEMSGIAN